MKLPFKYNAKSLFVRRGNTLMTVASIALVVLVFVGVLAIASGLSMSLRASGEALNVLVLRDGARSETESSFDKARQRLVCRRCAASAIARCGRCSRAACRGRNCATGASSPPASSRNAN